MNWTMVMIGFALAVLMGAGLRALLTTIRPEWPMKKRVLIAAAVLPAITLAAMLLVLLLLFVTRPAGDSGMHDLAIRVVLTIGGLFTATAFVGSLAGAWLSQLRQGS